MSTSRVCFYSVFRLWLAAYKSISDEDDDVEYEEYSTILTSMLKKTSEKRVGEMGQLDLVATVENLLPLGPGLRRYWSDTAQVCLIYLWSNSLDLMSF